MILGAALIGAGLGVLLFTIALALINHWPESEEDEDGEDD